MLGVRSWALGCVGALALGGCGPSGPVADGACSVLPGELVITEIHANPDGSDGDGEYIELFNPTPSAKPLFGLTLSTSRSDGTALKSHRLLSGSVPGGGHLVLGNASGSPIPHHVQQSYGDALGSLRNSDATLSLLCSGVVVDQVTYERTFDGRSLQLDGRFVPDHEANDDAELWCPSRTDTDPFLEGNFGTPGSPNESCEVDSEPVPT